MTCPLIELASGVFIALGTYGRDRYRSLSTLDREAADRMACRVLCGLFAGPGELWVEKSPGRPAEGERFQDDGTPCREAMTEFFFVMPSA